MQLCFFCHKIEEKHSCIKDGKEQNMSAVIYSGQIYELVEPQRVACITVFGIET
jgi:hypothetical protein